MHIDPSCPRRQNSTTLVTRSGKLRLAATAIAFLSILTIGNIPGAAQTVNNAFGDKVLHLLAYGCLGILLFTSFARLRATITLSIIVVMAGLDEFVQSFLSYRSADLFDLLTDVFGATVTVTACSLLNAILSGNTDERSGDPYTRADQPAVQLHYRKSE